MYWGRMLFTICVLRLRRVDIQSQPLYETNHWLLTSQLFVLISTVLLYRERASSEAWFMKPYLQAVLLNAAPQYFIVLYLKCWWLMRVQWGGWRCWSSVKLILGTELAGAAPSCCCVSTTSGLEYQELITIIFTYTRDMYSLIWQKFYASHNQINQEVRWERRDKVEWIK